MSLLQNLQHVCQISSDVSEVIALRLNSQHLKPPSI